MKTIRQPFIQPMISPMKRSMHDNYHQASGAVWTPADIASCRLLLDATDLTTLFTDVAGTTPVTASGQSVAAWRDKTANATLFTEGTLGNRPVYTESGGLKFLQFTGASQQRLASTLDLSGVDAVTIVAGVRRDSTSHQTIINQNITNAPSFLLEAFTDDNFRMWSRGDGAFLRGGLIAGGATPSSSVVVGTAEISPAFVTVYNGATQGTSSASSQGAGNYNNAEVRIGQRTNGTAHLNGRLYRLALFTTVLSAEDRALATAWALRNGE